MASSIEWGFFDRKDEAYDSQRNLPHKEQPGAITFVTMRLADSMPKHVVQQWHDAIESFLVENGLAGLSVDEVLNSNSVDVGLKRELRKFKNRNWHNRLDDCHGECVLRNPDVRPEVCKSLLHFDGVRYDVESFIVMPNHAHVLIQMREGFSLRKQFREIQRYSAGGGQQIVGAGG